MNIRGKRVYKNDLRIERRREFNAAINEAISRSYLGRAREGLTESAEHINRQWRKVKSVPASGVYTERDIE